MIIDMPNTTTREVNKRLLTARDEGGAVALGRVLTLVVDAGSHDPEAAIAAANAASHEHPCRVVVLAPPAPAASVGAPAGPHDRGTQHGALDAQIRLGGDAGASEVVVLRPATRSDEHLDTLVLPMLLPDAPIVVWWPFDPPADPAHQPLGRLAQRRVVDSSECTNPERALRNLAAVHTEGTTDMAWTRTTAWRGLLAATLDQPPYEPVTSVVVAGQEGHPSVDLLAAWLGQRLGCHVSVDVAPGRPAITRVELHRASGPIVIDRPDGLSATISRPDQPTHRITLPIRTLAECLAEELRRLDPDEVYSETVTVGLAELDASTGWRPTTDGPSGADATSATTQAVGA